jgi:hypothetical protein
MFDKVKAGRAKARRLQEKEKPPEAWTSQAAGGIQFYFLPGGRKCYFRTASLRTLEGRRRTTVFALILIDSPVWGLRPMRALR